jgi:predicted RNA methylase
LGFALVNSDAVYLIDCDHEALALAKENVDYLMEEEFVGTSCSGVEGDGGCMSVEIIAAKVKYVRQRGSGGGGRGVGKSGRGRGRAQKCGGKGMLPKSQPLVESPLSRRMDLDVDDGIPLLSKVVDTVITNPPFGTKNNEGIDVQFLRTAIRLARRAVYSFHKTSTRPYLIKLLGSWGLNVEVVAEMKFDIQNMYRFHKQKVKDVDVDLIRVFWEVEAGDEGFGVGDENDSLNDGPYSLTSVAGDGDDNGM